MKFGDKILPGAESSIFIPQISSDISLTLEKIVITPFFHQDETVHPYVRRENHIVVIGLQVFDGSSKLRRKTAKF